MGKTAKELLKADVNEVLSDLLKAYANEWLAHYQYWLTAHWMGGRRRHAEACAAEVVEEELKHAEKVAQRIIQPGGKPVMDFAQLLTTSRCGYIAPLDDPTDPRKVIEDTLRSEQCAIRFYSKMVEKYRLTDVVTHELFEELLEDEVEDEEEWERFLAKLCPSGITDGADGQTP